MLRKTLTGVVFFLLIVSCSFSEGRIEIHGEDGETQGQRVVLANRSSDKVITFTVKKEETTYSLKERKDMTGEKVGETIITTHIHTLNPGEQKKIGATWAKPVFRKVLLKRKYSIVGEVAND